MPNELVSTQRSKSTTMILGIVLTAVTFLSGRLVTPLALHFGLDDMMVRTATRAVVGVICLVVMGGASMLRPNLEKIRSAWFFARPLVIINIIIATLFGTWAVFLLLFFGELNASQLGNMFYVTVLCILVGINEEAMFRGLMFGGLLAGLGERKGGPVLAAVISSLAFGFAHVVFDISFDNAWGLLQGALKTIESGMFGLILCVSVLEERDLVGPITVHAFFDWILMIGNASAGSLPTANYVSTEQNVAIAGSVIFAVFIVLYLPKTIQSFRRLSAAPLPQYGPFVPAEESAKLTNTAWSDAHASNPEHMASREDRLRNHKVLDHKVLTIFATITVFMIVANLVAIVPMIVFGQGIASKVAVAVCNIALSLLMLFGYQNLFKGQLDTLVSWSSTGMLLVLPAAVYVLANIVSWPGATFNNPLTALILSMAPGFSEEIVFRAIPAANWMRIGNERRDIFSCVIATAAVFGLIHGMNILAGAALSSTLFQVFYAFCLGCLFAAVFLRTGSIWPCVILHTCIDFTSFLTKDMNNVGILSTELQFNPEFWIALVGSVIVLGWTFYLLRPAKQDEILALWKGKWHK